MGKIFQQIRSLPDCLCELLSSAWSPEGHGYNRLLRLAKFGFDSRQQDAVLAQLVERQTFNLVVQGSSPWYSIFFMERLNEYNIFLKKDNITNIKLFYNKYIY